ncbi:MAG: rhodanese-related sulfurtransferase [Rhodothermales bacterium]
MTEPVTVAAFYKFHSIDDPDAVREHLQTVLESAKVRGTILVAHEGLNGTIAGPKAGVDHVLAAVRAVDGFADLVHKESVSDDMPFLRPKVRLKKEIVTLGVEGVDPNLIVGTYVPPSEWNELISDPDVLLVDTRNDYEVTVGTFEGAVNPRTKSFREFPAFVEKELAGRKDRPVAMFCTGGIRCEKATSYLRAQGFEKVYHLQGGILKYLEEVPAERTRWNGECFVFDGRVTVNHDLEPGRFDMCHACRMPITEEDRSLESFEEGVSCRHCSHERSESDRERLRERQRQIQLAEERGEAHIGHEARVLMERKQAAP